MKTWLITGCSSGFGRNLAETLLSEISKILAENKIGIFVVSTYNTDYILVKKENLQKAQQALEAAGYDVV